MKKLIITICILAFAAAAVQAQNKITNTHGFWVVEHNVDLPRVQTVRFYNDNNKLMYEETVYNKLNIKRKRTRLALDQILDRLNERTAYIENKNLVMLSLNLRN
ncbi:hypothetical protein [Mucilaginibacter rubeus]|uniref:Uncharacterized protein n=1 Tax=Mucilaginibacter rubeus TaxID=2027860 RepID=A0A5C1I2M5_9SPHI|nr:hypothetical protein [Mucilaginibacter rubeus]QEM12145.1 hypothetical protein DEO27_019645 [Mucilaginibacter rubeus]